MKRRLFRAVEATTGRPRPINRRRGDTKGAVRDACARVNGERTERNRDEMD
ncbi:MAG: hypothetical protein PHP66_04425 [Syntrophales bacterium]|nr:hypothetical protein [Syntrophales bacterium]